MYTDVRALQVIGTVRVAARVTRVVPAVRTTRRAELITLPHVIGVAHRPLWSAETVRDERVAA